jgi:phosphoserine/homoserine phosphotransferase
MFIVCSDLEGVFIPEIWINVAEKTGIPELRLTTRDISDYDVLMKKLGRPTLLCHSLTVDAGGMIISYDLRQPQAKEKTTLAMKSLNYQVIAMGDSYNDIAMLKAADRGLLFRPPENVIREFPEFPVTHDYGSLKKLIKAIINE